MTVLFSSKLRSLYALVALMSPLPALAVEIFDMPERRYYAADDTVVAVPEAVSAFVVEMRAALPDMKEGRGPSADCWGMADASGQWALLHGFNSDYGSELDRRGLRLLRFGAHVQLATRPDYAPYVEKLLQPVQKQSLSQAVMETLAVIAYRQPVTKAEIEQIRGVKCDYSVQSLTAKGLIEEVGRKETLGRPILYGTTDAFLRHFCISSVAELPEIDFSALAAKLSGAGENQMDGGSAAEQ